MNRLTISALSGCGAAMLLGCATPSPQPQQAALGMQPVLRLQSGGEQRATYWYQLGKYHQARGELNLAMGAYAQSLALDGRQLDARMAVATIDARQGRLAAARDALQTLVADYPAQAQLSNNLGYVYYLMGDQQSAIAMLRRALVLDAASVKAQDNLRLAEAAALAGASSATLAATEGEQPPPTRAEMQQLQQQLHQLQERSAAAGLAPLPVAAAPDAAAPAAASPFAPATAVPASVLAVVAPTGPIPADIANGNDLLGQDPAPDAPAAAPAAAGPAVPAAAVPASVLAAVSAPAPAPVPRVLGKAPVDIANGNGLSRLASASAALAAAPAAASPAAFTVTAAASIRAAVSAPAFAPVRPVLAQAPVDIANGNGLLGLAKRFRRTLAQLGIPVGRLSNERPYRQQTTTIEYRPGYEQQALALQAALRGQAALMVAGPQATTGVRLVLGKDSLSEPAPAAATLSASVLRVPAASARLMTSGAASAKVN
jgi:hypothetical protein